LEEYKHIGNERRKEGRKTKAERREAEEDVREQSRRE